LPLRFACRVRETRQPASENYRSAADVYATPNPITSNQRPHYDVIQLDRRHNDREHSPDSVANAYDTLYSVTPEQQHHYDSVRLPENRTQRQSDVRVEYEEL